LCEGRAVAGTEEYLDSEKYQFRQWDWEHPDNIKDLVATINRIRRENPALHSNDRLTFCQTDNPNLIAFCKTSSDRANALLVIVNLDCREMQHGFVSVPSDCLALPQDTTYDVVDLLDGARYTWRGQRNYVKLDPGERAAHILQLPAALTEA
jgi:starch synthase (maltosyl-transferring)